MSKTYTLEIAPFSGKKWAKVAEKSTPPRPPAGLGSPGRRLWRSIVGPYVLNPVELTVLERACRTVDQIGQLEDELAELDSWEVTGRFAQPQTHPHVEQIRRLTVVLEHLLTSLKLPDEETRPKAKPAPASVSPIGGGRGRAS